TSLLLCGNPRRISLLYALSIPFMLDPLMLDLLMLDLLLTYSLLLAFCLTYGLMLCCIPDGCLTLCCFTHRRLAHGRFFSSVLRGDLSGPFCCPLRLPILLFKAAAFSRALHIG